MFLCMFIFHIHILWRKKAATGGGQLKRMFLQISQKVAEKPLCRSFYFNGVASGA